MKIQSKHKDYYDYVAHMYGGGDPLHTYVRNNLEKDIFIGEKCEVKLNLPNYDAVWNFSQCKVTLKKEEAYISIIYFCGRRFIVVSDAKASTTKVSGEIYNKERHGELGGYYNSRLSGMKIWQNFDVFRIKTSAINDVEDFAALKISREYNIPVFTLSVFLNKVYISKNIPHLGECGFPAIMSAEQCYQELANFVANRMKDSPDVTPPVVVEDKYKILAAGFDHKQSFRHRK